MFSGVMQEKIIFVFPGQGAQYVGMGADVFHEFASARYVFEQVSDIAKRDIAKLCFNGSQTELNQPENTSLATFAHSVAIANVIESEFGMPLYNIAYAMAGHSMGQYSALNCVGSMQMTDAVQMLAARATYMQDVAGAGGMAAIVGLPKDVVEQCMVAAAGHGYVQISNHNARDQFIISGHNAALDAVVAAAQKQGARIAKRLNIAVPAHCALMSGAEKLMRTRMESIQFDAPKTNWYSNQTANFMSNPRDVRDALCNQMTHGVRWLEIMESFPTYNITHSYELGPGRTLSGLIKRAGVGCAARHTDSLGNVRVVLREIGDLMVKTR
ncbi:MAG: ACP S-malonyltransferase [Alphaproteobacteria bacterium]|nr:ACP S-malonyltransferase [Alphaproteobacteria bacterium]MBQ4129788.1 ACP S-malonyltransferase [Alphaproteobacteria bacterium]